MIPTTYSAPRAFRWLAVLALAALLVGCGGKATPEAAAPGTEGDEDGHSHAAGPHGGPMAVVGDHIAHLEAIHDMDAGDVKVWVLDMDDKALTLDGTFVLNLLTKDGTTQVEGEQIGNGWHFADPALIGHPETARFRLSLGGKSYSVDLPCDHGHEDGHDDDHGHGSHDMNHGPHDGTLAAFTSPDGVVTGYVELKLHDDKGDLELWIATDETIVLKPFDLSLDAKIALVFHDKDDRPVTLQVRNRDRNEDEDDFENNRNGKTNYFIFPGDTGVDAAWLKGAEFSSEVSLSFERNGTKYTTAKFLLVPHTHAAGGHEGHEHE